LVNYDLRLSTAYDVHVSGAIGYTADATQPIDESGCASLTGRFPRRRIGSRTRATAAAAACPRSTHRQAVHTSLENAPKRASRLAGRPTEELEDEGVTLSELADA